MSPQRGEAGSVVAGPGVPKDRSHDTMNRMTVPSPERVDAAVRVIVDRLQPDQIILFGSAARGEMTRSSDLDLLVIKNEDDERADAMGHERWQCAEAGGQLDVLVTDRATAERNRLSAAHVHGAALEDGRTVYLRDGATATPTGPTYTWNGSAMVQTTKYEPEHASELLDTAERRWRTANREEHPVDRCKNLHESIEHAFKAIIVADGRRVEHRHELDKLWDQAEAAGEPIATTRDPEQLERLTRYSGDWRYDRIPADEDPEQTWKKNRATGEDVLNHARRCVPQLIEQTRKTLASQGPPTAIGEEPPAGPADAPEPAQGAAARQNDRNHAPKRRQ